jgi:hypothetical protein
MPDSRIQALTKRISETRPVDRTRRLALVNELKELRRDLDPRAREQAQRLDAALLLMDFMSRSEEMATAEGLQIVSGLVASVDERMIQTPEDPRGPQPAKEAPPPSDISQHADLRLTEEFMLGSILVQAKVVTQEALQRALELQSSTGQWIGQCLVQLGAASQNQIASAITLQDRMKDRTRSPQVAADKPGDPAAKLELKLSPKQKGFVQSFHAQVLLGEILIRLRLISREQLDRALQLQRAANLHIGEALIQTGASDWEAIRRGLEVQRQLRRSA